MSLQLPADIDTTLNSFLIGGRYESKVEVLREALATLKRRDEDVVALEEGFKDEASGRVISARAVVDRAKQRLDGDSA